MAMDNYDKIKNYSLLEYQQGTDESSRIVLLASELIETQQVMKAQFNEVIRKIGNLTNPLDPVQDADNVSGCIWIQDPTNAITFVSGNQTIGVASGGLYFWTSIGYFHAALPSNPGGFLQLDLLPANNNITSYLALEVYEQLLTGTEEPSIIDPNVNVETARRRVLKYRIRYDNNDYPSPGTDLNSDLNIETNHRIIKLGTIFRKRETGQEAWIENVNYNNKIGNGNEVKLYNLDVGASTPAPSLIGGSNISKLYLVGNNVQDVSGDAISLGLPTLGANDIAIKIVTPKFESPVNDYSKAERIIIPQENIEGMIGTDLTLKFPTTLKFEEPQPGAASNSIEGVETVQVPFGGFRITNNTAPVAVSFDPVNPEKRSLYNALLAQGPNFLFGKYSAIFFTPEDADPGEISTGNGLIDKDNSTAIRMYSNSNGFAYFDRNTSKITLFTKNIIRDSNPDLSAFMLLTDEENVSGAGGISWQYAYKTTGSYSLWITINPRVVVNAPVSGITEIKLKADIASTPNSTIRLKSVALFHSPQSSPNILRDNSANWEEIVLPDVSGNCVLSGTNAYTANITPSQLEVFGKNTADRGWVKLNRVFVNPALGEYREINATTIKVVNNTELTGYTKVLIRPIASAIDSNDLNSINIDELTTRLDTIESNYIQGYNGADNPVGMFKALDIVQDPLFDNLNIEPQPVVGSGIQARLQYKFSFQNAITNNVVGTANPLSPTHFNAVTVPVTPNPLITFYKNLNVYAPYGQSSNPDVGTYTSGNGFGITFSKTGTTANMVFKNLYFIQEAGSTTTDLGIPKAISITSGLEGSMSGTSDGLLSVGINSGKGLYLNETLPGVPLEVFLYSPSNINSSGLEFMTETIDVLNSLRIKPAFGDNYIVKPTSNGLELDFKISTEGSVNLSGTPSGHSFIGNPNKIRISKYSGNLPIGVSSFTISGMSANETNYANDALFHSILIDDNSHSKYITNFFEGVSNTLTCKISRISEVTYAASLITPDVTLIDNGPIGAGNNLDIAHHDIAPLNLEGTTQDGFYKVGTRMVSELVNPIIALNTAIAQLTAVESFDAGVSFKIHIMSVNKIV